MLNEQLRGAKKHLGTLGCRRQAPFVACSGCSFNGEIHIFKHGKKKQIVRRVRMGPLATKVRATPVAVNGVLYVITENPCRLWAIKKE